MRSVWRICLLFACFRSKIKLTKEIKEKKYDMTGADVSFVHLGITIPESIGYGSSFDLPAFADQD